MNEPFANVLVTGATSGIGEACAEWLAAHGARHVFFCGRDEARLAAVAERLRARSAERFDITFTLDVSDWGDEDPHLELRLCGIAAAR